MDLEGLVSQLLNKGVSEDEITRRLVLEIQTFKELDTEEAGILASSVLEEVKTTQKKSQDQLLKIVLETPLSGASMHDLGVGCRGSGDFFVHRLIAGLAGKNSLIPPDQQDDAGAVNADGKIIVSAIDGTHSRLSDYPFIAGFHVARAAMRDVMVKGAKPVALIDDLHLADDGDVGALFDFVAGVTTLAELSSVPLIAGSTLRVGGDVVIGRRMVSGVGCIGIADHLLKRADVKVGDSILMTQGAGGGTIATTAIYSGNHDVVKETINIDFIEAVNTLFESNLTDKTSCMLDVTNGGLRGDANEVCKTANVGIELKSEKITLLINKKVLKLLESQGIDPLGVSLDSLLIFCPKEAEEEILSEIRNKKIKIDKVGSVVDGNCASLDGSDFSPKFRESAYTPVKKLMGESAPKGEEKLKDGAEKAARLSRKKSEEVIKYVRKNRS